MKISELADELGVPTSAVIEQCKRVGIDATWAGAELSGGDVVVLRAEMASADAPIDLTPTDPPVEPSAAAPDAASSGPAVPPPTSVASMPDAAGAPAEAPASPRQGPGAGPAVPIGAATVPRKPEVDRRQTTPRLDKSVRGGIAALLVGILALVVGEVVSNPWVIWAMWVLAMISFLVALWNGNAGRRHVTTHPERYKGLGLAVLVMVLSVGLAIGVGASVAAAVGDDPAVDAPLGDRDSVAQARWGYQRLNRIVDESWKRPAKDEGTCWEIDDEVEREVDRIEVGTDRVNCDRDHTVQIIKVYAINRDADAAYPGEDALQADARERCAEQVAKLLDPEGDGSPIDGVLIGEIPTEDGWANADRDIACAVVTATRRGALD